MAEGRGYETEAALSISDDEIRAVARLARLELPDAEIEVQRRHINALLARFEAMRQLDLGGVEPTSHCLALQSVMRDDEVGESLSRGEVLSNAPQQRDGCFVVPRILAD